MDEIQHSDLRIPLVGGSTPPEADMGREQGVLRGDVLQGGQREDISPRVQNKEWSVCLLM